MTCALVLADGDVFYGTPFGSPPWNLAAAHAPGTAGDMAASLRDAGEVVFNTAMSGYSEVLTDPSYTGQIVVMTSPQIGNYGVSSDWAESDPQGSRPVKAAGFVVRDLYTGPVPPGRRSLMQFLTEHGVPGITGVDTRALTLNIRDKGSRNGLICANASGTTLSQEEIDTALSVLQQVPSMEGRSLVTTVGAQDPVHLPGQGGPHIALYDCGVKENIIRELQRRRCEITLLPSTASAQEIRDSGAAAIFLSNGPGDPAVLQHQVAVTRELLGELPVLGICLGHQIIAEAAGAKTFKMPFGHHGVNHPVREEVNGRRVFVTSQNHGFAVEEKTLPAGMKVWFRNANDQTVEGLWHDELRVRSAQFHPESAPGPHDSTWIFDAFLEAL